MPELGVLQPVQNRRPQGLLLLHVPRHRGPAAFVLRALKQVDKGFRLDGLKTTLDQVTVASGPRLRKVSARRELVIVMLEPACLNVAVSDFTGELNGKRAFGWIETEWITRIDQWLIDESVEAVGVPVELLLLENHA